MSSAREMCRNTSFMRHIDTTQLNNGIIRKGTHCSTYNFLIILIVNGVLVHTLLFFQLMHISVREQHIQLVAAHKKKKREN